MPITVHNVDGTSDGFGTTPVQTLAFTGSSGRSLIAIIDSNSANTVTSVTDSQSNVYTELFSTSSSTQKYFFTASATSVTTVTPTFSAGSTPVCWFVEVSGIDTATPMQDSSAYASDGDGFVIPHGYEYTTVEAGELVVAVARCTTTNRTFTGTNGSTAFQNAPPAAHSLVYEIISAAETADITWSMDAGGNCSASLISISPAAEPAGPVHPYVSITVSG
jgi:hypothetical protein